MRKKYHKPTLRRVGQLRDITRGFDTLRWCPLEDNERG
ncbi:MAG: lasso RiPP family leader peptide-containing protein [Armatimonadota bacterium]